MTKRTLKQMLFKKSIKLRAFEKYSKKSTKPSKVRFLQRKRRIKSNPSIRKVFKSRIIDIGLDADFRKHALRKRYCWKYAGYITPEMKLDCNNPRYLKIKELQSLSHSKYSEVYKALSN